MKVFWVQEMVWVSHTVRPRALPDGVGCTLTAAAVELTGGWRERFSRAAGAAGEGYIAVGQLAPQSFPSISGAGSRSNGHNGAAQHSKTDKTGAMTAAHSKVRVTTGTISPAPR